MIKIVRHCLILFAVLVFTLTGALAQDYPTQPIRIIVPYTAGGSSDFVARTVGAKMQENMGRAVVVENRPGGNAIIGTELVAKARPDGYTLLAGNNNTNSLMPLLNAAKLKYDISEKLIPIMYVNHVPAIFAAASSVPDTP